MSHLLRALALSTLIVLARCPFDAPAHSTELVDPRPPAPRPDAAIGLNCFPRAGLEALFAQEGMAPIGEGLGDEKGTALLTLWSAKDGANWALELRFAAKPEIACGVRGLGWHMRGWQPPIIDHPAPGKDM